MGTDNGGRRRRRWVAGVALLMAGAALAAGPEAGARRPLRIGALTDSWGTTPQILGLRDGLVALGYREHTDFVIGVRFTSGEREALPAAARELSQRGVDLIFASDTSAAHAALQATEGVPIVFAGGSDPSRTGLVQSVARPGGRVTGVTDLAFELGPKRLETLRAIVPGLKRVLFVYNGADAYATREAELYRTTAPQLGITLVEKPVRTPGEARAVLAGARRDAVDGILAPRFLSLNIPGLVLEATVERGVPAIFTGAFWVEQGALVSYGPDFHDSGRQAARLVDKIVKGVHPGEIPIETNPKIQLTVNAKVARQLGLQLPRDILLRADRIVE